MQDIQVLDIQATRLVTNVRHGPCLPMIASLAIYILGFSERIQKVDNNTYTQSQDRFLDAVTNSILHYNGHRDLVLITWLSIILSLVLFCNFLVIELLL